MEVKEAIIKKKLARKKLASKMTVGDTIELVVYISKNTAFLKSFQKKQLKDIMAKANSGEAVTLQDNIKLIEMKGVIMVYLVPNQMNVTSRSNRLERYSLTYDHKNHI